MRWHVCLVVAIAAPGCPGGGNGTSSPAKPNGPPLDPPPEITVDLPSVPAKSEVTKSEPTAGHAPAKRSPILDIMKAENEREMAELKKQREPAYYLAYQIVEHRVVSMDAEGGALITDNDDTSRSLDVEVRVGSPALDNTRAIADERENGLNTPMARRSTVPFGEDKQAISNALWLETDRRYREAVQALGYIRQDQATLKKGQNVPDFSAATAEVYV